MIEDFDLEKWEEEQRIIDEMFPNCPFSICIDLDEMNQVVSNEPRIVIQCVPCDIPCGRSGNRIYVYVNNNGNGITNKDMIKAMIDAGYHPECDHHFLEGFDKKSNITYEPFFGS